jgi:hypothetical protein
MKKSHMPLKLRKISFEYHFAFLSPTHVDSLTVSYGMCVLFKLGTYIDPHLHECPHFFDRFHIFATIKTSNGVATMASAAKKLVVGGEAAERIEEPRSMNERTEERTHFETKEEATKKDDSVDSSRFCFHCGENSCFVDTMF